MSIDEIANRLDELRRQPAPPLPDDLSSLPPPAQRYLGRALGSEPSAASGVRLRMTGSVMAGGRRLAISADEVLVPGSGFVWRAVARLGPIRVIVTDHYFQQASRVDVRLFGLFPMGGETGEDTSASSRGRLAAETIWAPRTLVPAPGVRWAPVDEDSATVHLDIDGVEEALTLTVAGDGRLKELSMRRWGDSGVSEHAALPYGFRVLEDRALGGCTIPTRLEGGWWFGTEQYQPEHASRFTIEQAHFA